MLGQPAPIYRVVQNVARRPVLRRRKDDKVIYGVPSKVHSAEIQLSSAASCRNRNRKHKNNGREHEFVQPSSTTVLFVNVSSL
jgi:hypothetical protein